MSESAKLVLILVQAFTVASAVLVTFHPNILYASVALLFTFLGVAVLFIFAGADLIAGVQVIIYVGGITILILFAIMLTQWLYHVKLRDLRFKMLLPLIVVFVGLLPFLVTALNEMSRALKPVDAEKMAAFAALPKTKLIGEALLGNYLLPFEAITVLLLGALVGAVWLARPK